MTNIGDWKSLAIILPNSVRLERSGYNFAKQFFYLTTFICWLRQLSFCSQSKVTFFLSLMQQFLLTYIMFSRNMWSQRSSRPETFATYVTGMGDPSDMVCFNVTWHRFQWQLLSTNIAGGQIPSITTCWEVSFGEHRLDLFVEILQIDTDFVLCKSYCCVKESF